MFGDMKNMKATCILNNHAYIVIFSMISLCVFSGCSSQKITACATQQFPPAAKGPGLQRIEAQESATLKARRELLNKIEQMSDLNGLNIGERMMKDPILRQEIMQTIRTKAKQNNALSSNNNEVSVFLSIKDRQIYNVTNPPMFYYFK